MRLTLPQKNTNIIKYKKFIFVNTKYKNARHRKTHSILGFNHLFCSPENHLLLLNRTALKIINSRHLLLCIWSKLPKICLLACYRDNFWLFKVSALMFQKKQGLKFKAIYILFHTSMANIKILHK